VNAILNLPIIVADYKPEPISFAVSGISGGIDMIGSKSLSALAVVGTLLAACQQSRPPAAQSSVETDALARAMEQSAKTHDKYVPTEAFKAKAGELGLRMVERLMTKCLHATNAQSMEDCYHERMLQGFDTDGAVKSHCPQQKDLEADMKCIVLGSMGHELVTKMGNNSSAAFDWGDPEQSATRIANEFVLQQVRDCLSSGAASDPKDCVVGRMTKALDLTSSDLDPCNAYIDEDFKFGQCIGEAFGYKYMSAAVARM
jgi:hypothetical protein